MTVDLSGPETAAPAPGRWRRRLAWLLPLGLLALLGAAYVGLYLVAGDKVPRGATVAGVEIGSLSADEAQDRLEAGLATRLARPVAATVNGRTAQVGPGAAGLDVDYAASVERAGGHRSWSPVRLWEHLAGGSAHEPVITTDDDRLAAAIVKLEGGLGTKARDGAIRFKAGKAVESAPVVGRRLDPETTEELLATAFTEGLAGDPVTARLNLVDVQPAIDAGDLAEARQGIVRPATSGPVRLLFGDYPVSLAPADYLPALAVQPQAGELVAVLRPRKVEELVERFTATEGQPVDATVKLVDGKPTVIPGKPGVKYDPVEVRTKLLAAITATGQARQARVAAESDAPDFTTAEAQALKIKEVVGEFFTNYPHAEYRNVNIGRAASLINGTVLKPGETFSLNGIVGERTAANGFTEGYMIQDGVLELSQGGGVSQLATTTFNAAFFGGFEDVEHKPHSFYISRYPAGREATVAWPYLDMSFKNDSPYGVLVQAWVDPSSWSNQGTVTVRLWSTKRWEIDDRSSKRYAYTQPKTRILTTPECEPHEPEVGFSIDVWRDFKELGTGKLLRSEKFHTVYNPADEVICEDPPPPPGPTETPTAE